MFGAALRCGQGRPRFNLGRPRSDDRGECSPGRSLAGLVPRSRGPNGVGGLGHRRRGRQRAPEGPRHLVRQARRPGPAGRHAAARQPRPGRAPPRVRAGRHRVHRPRGGDHEGLRRRGVDRPDRLPGALRGRAGGPGLRGGRGRHRGADAHADHRGRGGPDADGHPGGGGARRGAGGAADGWAGGGGGEGAAGGGGRSVVGGRGRVRAGRPAAVRGRGGAGAGAAAGGGGGGGGGVSGRLPRGCTGGGQGRG